MRSRSFRPGVRSRVEALRAAGAVRREPAPDPIVPDPIVPDPVTWCAGDTARARKSREA